MADLHDVWNWPNNSANGYATDSADWSGDASFGIDQRVDDVRTYTYKAHNTGSLHYTTDLSRTTDELNEGFAAYKNYFETYGDDPNPTFNILAKYPIVEWNIQPAGAAISGVHYELNSDNMPQIRIQFSAAHGLSNGDRIEFFGFDTDDSGRTYREFNTKQPYVTVSDSTNVILHDDASRTLNTQGAGFFAQTDVFFTALNDGSYNGAVLHFDVVEETFSTGDTLVIADTFTNMGSGTLGSATSPTTVYLEEIAGSNSYEIYSDVSRTTPFTILGGQGVQRFSTSVPFDIASSGSTVSITKDISDSSFATLRTEIKSQNMTPNNALESTSNIFRGFCRVQITQGAGVSKTIPTTMDESAYFGYKYNDTTETLEISTDPTLINRDTTPLTASFATGNVQGNIEIIDFWTYRNESPGTYGSGSLDQLLPTDGTDVGGLLFTGVVNDTTLSAVSPLTSPLAGLAGAVYSTKSDENDANNFDKLLYEFKDTFTRSPGRRIYDYKDANNVTQYGAEYDFTQFWKKGATSALTPSYTTSPSITPDLSAQGYIDGTNTITNAGLFTLSDLDLETDFAPGTPPTPATTVLEKVGLFPINPLADLYVAPTPYAPDVFDTDDEWDTDAFNDNKDWPNHIRPISAKIVARQPSSITASQNGTKYVRDSGIIRYQLEVTYPPMIRADFLEFQAVVEAARGQATPFDFSITNVDGKDILFQRTDSADTGGLPSPYAVRVRNPIAAGDKTLTVEGFTAAVANVFVRGEYIIAPQLAYANGNIAQVINDSVTSNKYGEAKIRIPRGSKSTVDTGTQFYKKPSTVVVTLADDDFEYTVGTDLLYRFSCTFDLDEFK